MEITDEEKKVLLLAARESIRNSFDNHPFTQIDYTQYPFLKHHLGAFVTLKLDSELRGCIGYIFAKDTLFNTICDAAKQAAFSDPRFFPLSKEEFERVKIEISIISSPHRISNYSEIKIGKHGLILEEKYVKAVLLPQVAVTHNFLCDQFLSALCEKGGLHPETWKIQKLNIMVFTATIISEDENE